MTNHKLIQADKSLHALITHPNNKHLRIKAMSMKTIEVNNADKAM